MTKSDAFSWLLLNPIPEGFLPFPPRPETRKQGWKRGRGDRVVWKEKKARLNPFLYGIEDKNGSLTGAPRGKSIIA